jgi:hypothetical protein
MWMKLFNIQMVTNGLLSAVEIIACCAPQPLCIGFSTASVSDGGTHQARPAGQLKSVHSELFLRVCGWSCAFSTAFQEGLHISVYLS